MARRARAADALVARVKICGIRSGADARLAQRLGAHAVGVLVGREHASPDFIESDEAELIVRSLPPFVAGVLVTHLLWIHIAAVTALTSSTSNIA